MTKPTHPKTEAPETAAGPTLVAAVAPSLDDLALGEITPPQALALMRSGLSTATPDEALEHYDALRSLVWKKFAERTFGDEMRVWHDVLRQAGGLFEVRGMAEIAAKLSGFSELAMESIRFGRANGIDEMQSRAHVREILESLSKRGGQAWREDVMRDTKLRHANLSRVLAHMASAGFVERRPHGRKVLVSLTSLGREAIASPPNRSPNALVVFPPIGGPAPEPAPRRRPA